MPTNKERKDSYGPTDSQRLLSALATPDHASDDEKASAARDMLRIASGVDSRDGSFFSKDHKPLTGSVYFTKMKTAYQKGMAAIEPASATEWRSLAPDEDTRHKYADERLTWWKRNAVNPVANLVDAAQPIDERELPDDVTPEDREAVKRERQMSTYMKLGRVDESSITPDAERPQALTENETKRLAALKTRIQKRRVIAEYESKIRAETVFLRYDTIKDELSDPAKEILKTVFRAGALEPQTFGQTGANTVKDIAARVFTPPWRPTIPEHIYEQFNGLTLQEQQTVSSLVYDARKSSSDNWLKSAGRQFLDMAVKIPLEAREKLISDAFRRQLMTDREYNKFVQTRALLSEMIGYKPQDYGEFGNAIVGTAATLPYMAEAMIPYAGVVMIAGQTYYEFERRVAAEGGDVTSFDFRLKGLVAAAASAAVERVQAGTFSKVPTAMQKRVMFLKTWRSATKSLALAGELTATSGRQVAEEAVQKGIEDGFVAYGTDRPVAREAVAGAMQELRDTALTMTILSGAGLAGKGIRINTVKSLSIDEMIAAQMHKARIRAGMSNISETDLQEDRDAVGELRDRWFRAGSHDDSVKAFQDIGFSDGEARAFTDMFQKEYTTIMESDKLSPEQKRKMIGQDTDVRAILLRAMPDAEMTEGPDGGFSFSRIVNTVKTSVNVAFAAGIDYDMNSQEAADSITQALRDATRGAPDGQRVDMTPQQWLDLPDDAKLGYIKIHNIRANGFFTPVDPKNRVTEGGLNVLAGTIHLDRAAHPATIFHEYFHGFVQMLKDAGVWHEADSAKAREEFGAPTREKDDFNEEAAAPAFQGFVAGQINPPETSVLRHLWNALAAILNTVRGKRQQAAQAATIRASMFEQALAGNFSGIPVATIASTEAARQPQTASQAARPSQAAQGQAQGQAAPGGVILTTQSAPVAPVARYAPGDAVTGSHTDPDGTRRKGTLGTVDEVINNADGSFSYRVRWENGKSSVQPETFFFEQPAPAAALLTPADLQVQPVTPRTTGRRPRAASKAANRAERAGGVSFTPVQEAAAREEAAKVAAIRGQKGRGKANTPGGKFTVEYEWAVVDVADPITSDRPDYDQGLQGRDTSSVETALPVNSIGKKPRPLELFDSPLTDGGAPFLDRLMRNVTGNAPTLGLRLALKLGNYADYERWVRAKAAEFGIDIPSSIRHPMLVRIITSVHSTAEMHEIAELSNKPSVRAFSPAELATSDAGKIISSGLLNLFAPDASGNIFAASNRDFMNGFVQAVGGSGLRDGQGNPTDEAGDRVRRAMLAIIAGRGPDARNVIRALVEESRAVGMSRIVDGAAKAAGELVSLADIKPEFSLLDELALALREFMQFKLDNAVNVREWVGQAGLFGPGRPAIIDKLIIEMADRNTAGGVYAMLKAYYEKARAIDTKTGDKFGAPLTSKEAILDLAIQQTAEPNTTRYSVTATQDRAYLDAVEKGDTAAAQRMVDEAAKKAGYNIGPVWHGGTITTRFRDNPAAKAHYVSEDMGTAASFAEQFKPGEADVKPLYLKAENVLDLTDETAFRKWIGEPNDQYHTKEMRFIAHEVRSGSDLLAKAQEQGFDAIKFYDTDVMDRGSAIAYAFFAPSNAKFAPNRTGDNKYWDYSIADGTVTHTDSGRVIPLSERFNTETPDIRYSVSASAEKRADKQFRKVIEGEYETREKKARDRFHEDESDEPVTYNTVRRISEGKTYWLPGPGDVIVNAPDSPGVREFARRHDLLLQRRTRGEAAIQAETDRLSADPRATDRQRKEWARVDYSYSLAESAEFTDLLDLADIADVEIIPIHSKTFATRQVGNVLFISDPESGQFEIQKALFRTALAGGSPNAESLVARVDVKARAFTQFSSLLTDINAALGLPASDRKTVAQEIAAQFFAADGDTSAQLMQPAGASVDIGEAFTDPDAAEGDVIGIMDDWDSGQVSVQETFRYSMSARQGQPVLSQAFDDWTSKRAYIDNAGNYRVRDMVEVAGVMIPDRGGGKIAPWNKAVKAAFPDTAAFHQAAQRGAGQQTFRYSVSASEARDWSVALRFYEQGMLDTSKPVTVLEGTPRILQACGADNLPLVINKSVLDKITKGKHAVTVNDLRNLQNVIDDPIAVFKSTSESESIIVLTEIKEGDANAVVAIHLNEKRGWSEINDIASIYGRDAFNIQTWMKERRTLYYNTQKTLALFRSSGLIVPVEVTARGQIQKVLTEQDFNIPPSAGDVNTPRNAMQASAGQYSNGSYLVADAAARILAGQAVDTARYARLATAMHANMTGQQIVDKGNKLAEAEAGKAAKAALSGQDPTEAITILAKANEIDVLRAAARAGVRQGAQTHATLAEIGKKATDAGTKAILAAVRGEDLQTFTIDTGIDLTKTLLSVPPEQFTERPEGEAQANEPGQPGQPPADQVAREVTPEELAARTARSSSLIDLVKNWWAEERAKRQKRADDRAAILARGGTLSEEQAESEQEDDSPITAIPMALLEATKVNLNSAQEVAHLFRVWVGQWIIEHSAGKITSQNVWKDAESVEKYRKTIVQQLQDMAEKLVDATDHALPNIMRTIGDIAPSMSVNEIERMSAHVIAAIQRNAIRQDRQKSVDAIAADIRKLAIDGREFDPNKSDIKRKVTAEVERTCRLLAKIIYFTDRKADEEVARITEEKKQRAQAIADSHNPDADINQDAKYNLLDLELQMINRWAGLKYRMPADIQKAGKEIHDWLTGEKDRLMKRLEDRQELVELHVSNLVDAISRDPDKHARPEAESTLDSILDSLQATVRTRLMDAIRYSTGEVRRKALESVEFICYTIGEAEQTYGKTIAEYRMQEDKLYHDVSAGQTAEYQKHLDEPIPDDVARVLTSKEQGRQTLSFSQAIRLYAMLDQTDSVDAIVANGRQDHIRILQGVLTAQDLQLVNRLRQLYAARREALSDAAMENTGLPVYSPDPNYVPKKKWMGVRAGLGTQTRSWTPWAKELTPRVKNKRDFDESSDIEDMMRDSNESSARSIAFGGPGSVVRDILSSSRVKTAISRFHGTAKTQRLTTQLLDTFLGIERTSGAEDRIARTAMAATAVTSLAYNPGSVVKQVFAIPAWAQVLEDGFKGVWRYLWAFDLETAKMLMQTDGARARYGYGMSPEYAQINRDRRTGGRVRRFYSFGMKGIEKGDMIASLAVGVGLYKAKLKQHLDENMSPEAAHAMAATEMWNKVEESQQSARPSNMAPALRGSYKIFFQFQSPQMLQYAHLAEAARTWRAQVDPDGTMNIVQAIAQSRRNAAAGIDDGRATLVRRIFLNHVLLPLVMQSVNVAVRAMIGDDDDPEEIAKETALAMLFGPVSHVFLAGAILMAAGRGLLGLRQFGSSMPAGEKPLRIAKEAVDVLRDLSSPEDFDPDKLQKDVVDLLSQFGAPFRLPIKAWKNYSE